MSGFWVNGFEGLGFASKHVDLRVLGFRLSGLQLWDFEAFG